MIDKCNKQDYLGNDKKWGFLNTVSNIFVGWLEGKVRGLTLIWHLKKKDTILKKGPLGICSMLLFNLFNQDCVNWVGWKYDINFILLIHCTI